jgi:hypothetical protein
MIRAEEKRVLFGFWRGKRLQSIEPRLKPSGKYEMARLELQEGGTLSSSIARHLATEAVALNKAHGNPTNSVRKKTVAKKRRSSRTSE